MNKADTKNGMLTQIFTGNKEHASTGKRIQQRYVMYSPFTLSCRMTRMRSNRILI